MGVKQPINFGALDAQLKDINRKYKYINGGGCGIFALMLGDILKKHNVKFKYVLITYNEDRTILQLQRQILKDIESNNLTLQLAHVMIYYKGMYIDSTGVYKNKDATNWYYYGLGGVIPEHGLKQWVKNECWNDMYNTTQTPKIKKDLKNLQLT